MCSILYTSATYFCLVSSHTIHLNYIIADLIKRHVEMVEKGWNANGICTRNHCYGGRHNKIADNKDKWLYHASSDNSRFLLSQGIRSFEKFGSHILCCVVCPNLCIISYFSFWIRFQILSREIKQEMFSHMDCFAK